MTLRAILKHSVKSRCPRCGVGPVFEKWGVMYKKCSLCELRLRDLEGDTWFFMYISTAVITGFFLIGLFVFTPTNAPLAKVALAIAAFATFFATQHRRKSIAIGIEFYLDEKWKRPRTPTKP